MENEETIIPSESEVIDQAETTVEETQQTIADMSADEQPEVEVRTVPESVFVQQKKALQKAEKELKALKQSIENGASQGEIDSDIDSIADKYEVDKGFLEELSSTIKAQAKKDLEQELTSKQIAQQKAEKFEKAFNNAYTEALERGPEFSAIANADVIRQLALLPQNAKKTISQILEDTYGNALTGKRTIETTKPGGGKDPEPLDLKRAEKDIEYFKEVMNDPKKKEQYNNYMLSKGF